ncbi:hypothetical protein BN128_4625 [Cronobacter sakazakii 696]|nr:hypothetical protein BN128_4625 [Cronobacter sakazakii 696]
MLDLSGRLCDLLGDLWFKALLLITLNARREIIPGGKEYFV